MFRRNTLLQYKLNYKKILTLKKQVLPDVKDEINKLSFRCVHILRQYKQNKCNQWIPQVLQTTTAYFSINHKSVQGTQESLVSQKYIKQLEALKHFSIKNKQVVEWFRKPMLFSTAAVAVTDISVKDPPIVIEPIPEPPAILETDLLTEVATQLNALGEPTLSSLGLACWTPVGMVQRCLEFFHVTLDLPWWGAIALGTVIVRLLMFPLVVIAQRNAAKMNNYMPQLQAIQLKMTEARQSGNQLEAARYSQEMMLFLKEKNLNPLKNMIVPLAQMPLFISFFVGLRKMANLPVESMRQGGMLWFPDLTVPDEFFALPVITSLTLWITIEIGTDTARLSSQNLQTMKYVLRALPIIIFPFTMNFPGAILCYWASSNFVSLAQVGFLRIPAVREYFKIEALLKHDPSNLPIKSKGFVEGLKDTWTNSKITRELEERRRFDELQFKRAGRGPVVRTYKYDPTQQTNPNAMSAKKR